MSAGPLTPDSSAKQSSTNESEGSTGFRSFWRRPERNSISQEVTFVQQDPSEKRKSNRLSRLFRAGSSTSAASDETGGDSSKNASQKRRQQVYQAQKRHRNRKAEYVQTLEAEVARLQQLDAAINTEANQLAHENQAIKELLRAQAVDVQLDAISFSSPSSHREELSSTSSVMLDVRFDPQMDHKRTFMDFLEEEVNNFNSSSGSETDNSRRLSPKKENKGDSWAALDFILALEWPCQDHVAHAHINPGAKIPAACDVGQFHGHALTAMSAVYASAHAPPQTSHERSQLLSAAAPQPGLSKESQEKWQLPHSEIDKLVALSEKLELDDEQLTPAQAYSAIKEHVPGDDYLRPVLEALKEPLSSLVNCYGFGAVVSTDMFWQCYDGVIQTLNFTRPELVK